MCGRYAMGAAHLAFLNDLQGQYAGLFRAHRFENDESQDPMRLRGGAPEHLMACQCGIKWEREGDFWPRFPVVPEVGKIGKSDPSYILPVAERKDGIRSFFAKQSPKKVGAPAGQNPPKPRSKVELMRDVKDEVKDEDDKEIKPKVEDEAKPQVKEELHDQAKPEPPIPSEIIDVDAEPPQKRKRQPDHRGRQTKVMRPAPDKSGQKSITSFFKSPRK
ncbi:hypothetical protein CspHIS471_0608390 [Cutaneotrichosporon sp. HIS471]|nr:hypothetical protein CspHIS471_0608390 [Cutaneotrichosporon sp. HIS471]